MATSKLPIKIVAVPQPVIELARVMPQKVVCNLRPEQRPPDQQTPQWMSRAELYRPWVDKPLRQFLRQLPVGGHVAILLQNCGGHVGILTCPINQVCWSEEEYPALDFDSPRSWTYFFGVGRLWGAFILAIVRVDDGIKADTLIEPDVERFIEIVRQHGVSLSN